MASENIFWVDVETTGLLDSPVDQIIELAALITTHDLEILGRFPSYVVKPSDEALNNLSEWAQENYVYNGLLAEAAKSEYTLEDLDSDLEAFLDRHGMYDRVVTAGSCVNFDLKFIKHNLPKVAPKLHYRTIDVSSVAELMKRWGETLHKNRPKQRSKHRAEDDIQASLDELIYYKEVLPMLG